MPWTCVSSPSAARRHRTEILSSSPAPAGTTSSPPSRVPAPPTPPWTRTNSPATATEWTSTRPFSWTIVLWMDGNSTARSWKPPAMRQVPMPMNCGFIWQVRALPAPSITSPRMCGCWSTAMRYSSSTVTATPATRAIPWNSPTISSPTPDLPSSTAPLRV